MLGTDEFIAISDGHAFRYSYTVMHQPVRVSGLNIGFAAYRRCDIVHVSNAGVDIFAESQSLVNVEMRS
jgi:hypothetical protein